MGELAAAVEEAEFTEDNSLMDDLAAAWDAAESDSQDDSGVDYDTEIQQSDVAGEPEPVDNAIGGPQAQPGEHVDGNAVPGSGESAGAEAGASGDGPPVGLSPAAREAWKDTPKPVQDAIRKREQDYEAGVMKYAENAKRAEAMDRVFQPFSQLFAMNGGPQNIMPGLLQTASMLQMGSPAQKAEQVAQLIKKFGVDIRTLDTVLVGQKPKPSQQDEVAQLVEQRMQQYTQQQQAVQQQHQQAAVQSEIQKFAADPENEFYRDVAADMADILDMAARRSQSLTLKDAYSRACGMNPQISQILSARQAQATSGGKRRAASSISGTPGGPGGGGSASNSLRGAIEEAWENAGRT